MNLIIILNSQQTFKEVKKIVILLIYPYLPVVFIFSYMWVSLVDYFSSGWTHFISFFRTNYFPKKVISSFIYERYLRRGSRIHNFLTTSHPPALRRYLSIIFWLWFFFFLIRSESLFLLLFSGIQCTFILQAALQHFFSSYLFFNRLIIMHIGVFFFVFFLLGVSRDFWFCDLISFYQFWHFDYNFYYYLKYVNIYFHHYSLSLLCLRDHNYILPFGIMYLCYFTFIFGSNFSFLISSIFELYTGYCGYVVENLDYAIFFERIFHSSRN